VTRTFVSGTGTANSSCSYTAPCRFFTQAVAALPSQGGEIDVLDPGSYGQITITNNVSIVGRGWTTITATPNTSAISVTGSGVVNINGVQLDGGGTGQSAGISFTGSGSLSIQDSVIRNFVNGIFVQPASGIATVAIKDVTVLNNSNAGIYLTPNGDQSVYATLDHVTTDLNNYGMYFDASHLTDVGNLRVAVSDSHTGTNGTNGLVANGGGIVNFYVAVKNTVLMNNLSGDFVVSSATGAVRILHTNTIGYLGIGSSENVGSDGSNFIDSSNAGGTLQPIQPH
jgi:hypothetical protein